MRYLEALLYVLYIIALPLNPREEAAEEWRRSLSAQTSAGALGEDCQVFSHGQGCGRGQRRCTYITIPTVHNIFPQ